MAWIVRSAIITLGVCAGLLSPPAFAFEGVAISGAPTTFAERVAAIDRDVGHVFHRDAILNNKAFEQLASEGREHIDSAFQFLSAEGYSKQQRMIAILSMCRLELKDYVFFLKSVVTSERLLKFPRQEIFIAVASPSARKNLVENYDNVEVRNVLGLIADRADVSAQVKAFIEDVLSGKAWVVAHFGCRENVGTVCEDVVFVFMYKWWWLLFVASLTLFIVVIPTCKKTDSSR